MEEDIYKSIEDAMKVANGEGGQRLDADLSHAGEESIEAILEVKKAVSILNEAGVSYTLYVQEYLDEEIIRKMKAGEKKGMASMFAASNLDTVALIASCIAAASLATSDDPMNKRIIDVATEAMKIVSSGAPPIDLFTFLELSTSGNIASIISMLYQKQLNEREAHNG